MPNFNSDVKRSKIKEGTSPYWQRLKAKHLLVWCSHLCPEGQNLVALINVENSFMTNNSNSDSVTLIFKVCTNIYKECIHKNVH